MIFVTVGTHEQPFNRLIKKIDLLQHGWRIDWRSVLLWSNEGKKAPVKPGATVVYWEQ